MNQQKKMTSKERMDCAMRGLPPDRTPVMCQLGLEHIYKYAGLGPVEYWYTSEGIAEGYIRMAERYHFDGILLNWYGRDPAVPGHVKKVEAENSGHQIIWDDGKTTFAPPDDYPIDILQRRSLAAQDIAALNIDDLPVWQSEADLEPYYFDVMNIVMAQKGKTMSIHGEVCAGFGRLLGLFGPLQNGLIALIDDPEKCKAVLAFFNANIIVEALAQCRRGIDALKISSAYAGAGFISRDMYKEFVLPYEKELVECVHAEFDIPVYLHTCGAIGDRLDLMVQMGIDGIECLDPAPLGTVDLAEAVQLIGDRLFIKGNLDSVNELAGHTPAEVKAIALKRIEIGRKAKGYILSSACSVSSKVPPENILALYEAVEEFKCQM